MNVVGIWCGYLWNWNIHTPNALLCMHNVCRLWPMWGAVRTSNTPNQTRIWHWPETIFIHSRLWIEHVMGLCCTCLVRTLDVGGKKPIVLRSTQWDTLSCEIITTYIWFANRSFARSLGERKTCAIHWQNHLIEIHCNRFGQNGCNSNKCVGPAGFCSLC